MCSTVNHKRNISKTPILKIWPCTHALVMELSTLLREWRPQFSGAVALDSEPASESPEGLVKTQIPGPTPDVPDSVPPQMGPENLHV